MEVPKSFLENSNYQIVSSIGGQKKRKLNAVFLVNEKTTKEEFVLKSINKEKNSSNVLELLKNEGKKDFSLSYLPKVVEIFEDEVHFAILLQYKKGKTLNAHFKSLKKNKRIPFLLQFIKKLKPIFKLLKERGIVHGDIKPSNFIIEELENDFEVHLIDFGLSFETNTAEERKIIFPLVYSAPELILNRLDLSNQQADYFALGITIYYLLAGEFPFSHPNPAVLTNLQLTYPISNKARINKDVFKIIEKMCLKPQFSKPPNLLSPEKVTVLIKNCQEKRYQSFEEIALDFEKIKTKPALLKNLIKILTNPQVKSKI